MPSCHWCLLFIIDPTQEGGICSHNSDPGSVRLSVQDGHHTPPTASKSTPGPLQAHIGVHPTWSSFSSGPLDNGGTISRPPPSYPRELCHKLRLGHHFASQDGRLRQRVMAGILTSDPKLVKLLPYIDSQLAFQSPHPASSSRLVVAKFLLNDII